MAKHAADDLRSKAQQLRALRAQVKMITGDDMDYKWEAIIKILDIQSHFDYRLAGIAARLKKLEGADNAKK